MIVRYTETEQRVANSDAKRKLWEDMASVIPYKGDGRTWDRSANDIIKKTAGSKKSLREKTDNSNFIESSQMPMTKRSSFLNQKKNDEPEPSKLSKHKKLPTDSENLQNNSYGVDDPKVNRNDASFSQNNPDNKDKNNENNDKIITIPGLKIGQFFESPSQKLNAERIAQNIQKINYIPRLKVNEDKSSQHNQGYNSKKLNKKNSVKPIIKSKRGGDSLRNKIKLDSDK